MLSSRGRRRAKIFGDQIETRGLPSYSVAVSTGCRQNGSTPPFGMASILRAKVFDVHLDNLTFEINSFCEVLW